MFSHATDFDRTFDVMDQMLRRFDRFFDGGFPRPNGLPSAFSARLVETDDELVFSADLPGLRSEDVDINLHDNVLTVQGRRETAAPEGYTPRRLERGNAHFARSFSLPVAVDPEKTTAAFDDGVLTVRLPKSEEARPRRIAISS